MYKEPNPLFSDEYLTQVAEEINEQYGFNEDKQELQNSQEIDKK